MTRCRCSNDDHDDATCFRRERLVLAAPKVSSSSYKRQRPGRNRPRQACKTQRTSCSILSAASAAAGLCVFVCVLAVALTVVDSSQVASTRSGAHHHHATDTAATADTQPRQPNEHVVRKPEAGRYQQHQQQQQVDNVNIPTSSSSSSSKIVQPPRIPSNNDLNDHNDLTQQQRQQQYDDFMIWCTQVLGIQTSLVIRDFDYPNYLQTARILSNNDDDDDEYDELCNEQARREQQQQQQEEVISVRGLAASHDIQEGDVVISIPFYALISVPTTIDHDPVLSGLLGPNERARFGWDSEEDASYFETPLLTIAILYHKQLGTRSPLYNYITLLEATTAGKLSNNSTTLHNKSDFHQHDGDSTSMPLLWSKQKLRTQTTESVQKLVKSIESDVREMYDTVMLPLKREHPAIFGGNDDKNDEHYSLSAFRWAFCMVNSRHWYLPIPDLSESKASIRMMEESEYGMYNEQVLPASQPTDEWVREQGEQDIVDSGIASRGGAASQQQDIRGTAATAKDGSHHSFMAPLGDLLNFGPPCTRGAYNNEKRTFELIATCSFLAGQEVTFWYSDDCEDVMIANYGFTHPMVPRCPSAEDWREKSQLWKERALALETSLEESFKELGRMDVELEEMRLALHNCGCDEAAVAGAPGDEKHAPAPNRGPTKLRRWRQEPTEDPMVERADGLRDEGDANDEHNDSHARHGIRKKWHRRGSNSGSSSL